MRIRLPSVRRSWSDRPLWIRWSVFVAALAVAAALTVTGLTLTSDDHTGGEHGHASQDKDKDKDAESGEEGEGEDDGGPAAPAEYLTKKFTSGHDVTPEQVHRAEAQAAALPTSGGSWSLVGPSNVGGRITDLVVDPRRPDTVYVAASGGGVWRSTDAGATFHAAGPPVSRRRSGRWPWALTARSGRAPVRRTRPVAG